MNTEGEKDMHELWVFRLMPVLPFLSIVLPPPINLVALGLLFILPTYLILCLVGVLRSLRARPSDRVAVALNGAGILLQIGIWVHLAYISSSSIHF